MNSIRSAFGVAALACLVALASSHAQSQVIPFPKGSDTYFPDRPILKFALADLAAVDVRGAGSRDGITYHIGGKVKNVGTAEYSRTRTATGAFAGRTVQLYAVNPVPIARRDILLRTVFIPSLKANQTWEIPTMVVLTRDVPVKGNATFYLVITPGDADRGNDYSKRIVVEPTIIH